MGRERLPAGSDLKADKEGATVSFSPFCLAKDHLLPLVSSGLVGIKMSGNMRTLIVYDSVQFILRFIYFVQSP